ncbi:hypothetical protein [Bernardetia litoralis]|nr:hypothetical protein [Bernardetia litoralis]
MPYSLPQMITLYKKKHFQNKLEMLFIELGRIELDRFLKEN